MLENYIDLIIIFYLATAFLSGLRKSLPSAIADLASLVLAIAVSFLAFRFTAGLMTNNFKISPPYANALGFFINMFVFKTIFVFIFDALFSGIEHLPEGSRRGVNVFERFLSGIASIFHTLVMVIIMLSATLSLSLPAFATREISDSRFGSFAQRDVLKTNEKFKEVFGGIYEATLKDVGFLERAKTGQDEKVDLGIKTLNTSIDGKEEEKMLEMVNNERTSRGLKALKIDEEARRAARDYGQYLFKNGIFSHTDLEGKGPGDRIKNYKVEYMIMGENLAYAPSLEEAHNGLMNSKGHRENILNPFYSHVGIGVIDGGDYGKIFVQEFWG